MDLLLIGPRASGKSTIGRALAERLEIDFVDLDDAVLATFSEPTVKLVWKMHGEIAWRSAEAWCLRQALDGRGRVIALGGGTPMIPDSRQLIEEARAAGRATVVYLELSEEVLKSRLSRRAGDRPSLTGGDVADEVSDIVAERRPTYEALADITIDPASGEAAEAAGRIIEATRAQAD